MGAPDAPRVFISYSHDSKEHQDRVLALANRLRASGVDAWLDQYFPNPPLGWPIFTEQQILNARYVLVVCSETYVRRIAEREEDGRGLGVLWEATIIYNLLYEANRSGPTFVPILFRDAPPSAIPTPLRGLARYMVDSDIEYESLFRLLVNPPRSGLPPLGASVALPIPPPQSYPSSPDALARSRRVDPNQRSRAAILKRVRSGWIDGVLNQSLGRVARIELALASRPEAVDDPLMAIVVGPQPLAEPIDSKAILRVFEGAGRAMLVLGAPGSGKSTLLLELADQMIARAEADDSEPIPVVFKLSSWAAKRRPFHEWLLAELNLRYGIATQVAKDWIERDDLLLLLDGLDEVVEEHRSACVKAINDFRRGHGLVPLAVCSRTDDYEVLGTKLRLQSAIVIQPLTGVQVDNYLQRASPSAHALRAALRGENALFAELLESPLMLSVAMLAYRDTPVSLGEDESLTDARRRLFKDFVAAMLKRRPHESGYTAREFTRWLSRLAVFMMQTNQTIFHPDMEVDSVLPARRRWFARIGLTTLFLSPVLLANFTYGAAPWVVFLVLTLTLGALRVLVLVVRRSSTPPRWWPTTMGLTQSFMKMLLPQNQAAGMKLSPLYFTLWLFGWAPLLYRSFLTSSVDLLFLRKVDRGFIFTHRFLMEYFASHRGD